MTICTRCNQELPDDQFKPARPRPGKMKTKWCQPCRKQRNDWYAVNDRQRLRAKAVT